MTSKNYKRLTLQQRYELINFVKRLKGRQLLTNDVRYILVLLRESTREEEFVEWGSAVAHLTRDRGWLYQNVISIWATHVYYEYLDRSDVRLSPLPANILDSIIFHLEHLSTSQVFDQYGHLVPQGTTADEIIATIVHLYACPGLHQKNRAMEAFYHFVCNGGIDETDESLLAFLIVQNEDAALSIGPRRLSEIVISIEQAIKKLGIGDLSLTAEDKEFLQCHLLVAFHTQVIDICPRTFQSLTGQALGVRKIILFLTETAGVLTLEVGFFEINEHGFFEPASIRLPYSIFKTERFSFPVIASDLCSETCLAEFDDNLRYSLHAHPIKVIKKKGKFQISVGTRTPDHEWYCD